MGKKDVISKIYLGEADRIADLLNNELFEGSKVVEASDIMERDSVAAKTWKEEDHPYSECTGCCQRHCKERAVWHAGDAVCHRKPERYPLCHAAEGDERGRGAL